jgi:prepilin-type N-terminal cleavage/methylation domain-containing protein
MLRARTAPDHGFTLVEIMVVILVISVLATLAVPAVAKIQRRARTTAIVNDFRVFAAAFDTYAHENGGWPADTAAGVLPAAMTGRINAAAFTRQTPMGGQYNWEYNQLHFGVRYTAAISIAGTAASPLPLDVNQLLDLERTIDSQYDPLGGTFHVGTGFVPLYLIQQ